MSDEYDIEVNAFGLRCPLPLLRTKEAIRKIGVGQVVRVVASDPQARRDFEVFAQQGRHTLLKCQEMEGKFVFLLQKGG